MSVTQHGSRGHLAHKWDTIAIGKSGAHNVDGPDFVATPHWSVAAHAFPLAGMGRPAVRSASYLCASLG